MWLFIIQCSRKLSHIGNWDIIFIVLHNSKKLLYKNISICMLNTSQYLTLLYFITFYFCILCTQINEQEVKFNVFKKKDIRAKYHASLIPWNWIAVHSNIGTSRKGDMRPKNVTGNPCSKDSRVIGMGLKLLTWFVWNMTKNVWDLRYVTKSKKSEISFIFDKCLAS